ncbi:Anaphase-promoting complex subunit 10 [Gigaspora margarita]|uniref:Anaphase-promoting complex subunit 10 n=1 Tax=Gigaspora margarita TaxID=4874 RepID=A0A8H3WXX9_GIGMA|nr:Anaphase-promoting complex subunit 10 [Gigaspora margarita]
MNDLNRVPDDSDDIVVDDMIEIEDEDESMPRREKKIIKSEFKHEELREIGSMAIWTLSSWKAGNGVENLRDNSMATYWQSDGTLPHLVNIQFPKKVSVVQISIWLDYKNDESYTPNKITIRAGTNFGDLQDLRTVDIEDPYGWVDVQLSGDHTLTRTSRPVGAHIFQISIKSNQQNGKDTHVRQIKIFAPKIPLFRDDSDDEDIPFFSELDFLMHTTVR